MRDPRGNTVGPEPARIFDERGKAARFIDMCKELRALGAVMVADGDMVAKFSPVTAALVHQQGVSGVPMTDKDKPMTPEQAREAMRRRELGL